MERGRESSGVVATVGVFDGVHRGHQELVARVLAAARRSGARPVALTFDPPPAVVLRGAGEPFQITPGEGKRELLEALGLADVRCLAFTPALARQTPAEFVARTLLGLFPLEGLVVGYDFRFGAGGAGDAGLLRVLGRERGFWVEEVAAVLDGGEPISSTRIRELLRRGDVATAAHLLGRPFSLAGAVGRGLGVGHRELVPTANLDLDPCQLLPADGVYVVAARLDRERGPAEGRAAVASVGTAPTLRPGAENRLVEVHLLDFDGELYGRLMGVSFLERLRGQETFPGLAELRLAIERDIAAARAWWSERRGG